MILVYEVIVAVALVAEVQLDLVIVLQAHSNV